ncbi:MAG: DUF4249 domain-containing protein [Bacteroidota bacterium]|jgi:hypothetical protein
MIKFLKNTFILVIAITIISCEDVIKVDLEGSKPQLVVDAFINDSLAKQTIKLRLSKSYLDNGTAPAATGAEVTIEDAVPILGGVRRKFVFTDDNNDGNYEWTPTASDIFPLGIPGLFYSLKIKYKGEEFQSFAKMDSVPKIDSLGYEFVEQEIRGPDTLKAGYNLTMVAKDLPGQTNGYWFKTFKNGKFFNKPGDMNLAYDAAFAPGSDGVAFVAPIIFNLSPERYQIGDSVVVECHSVGIATWFFLNQAQSQMNNGGLFATPVVNVPSNIENVNKNSDVKATGWFCAASISRKALRVK